MKLSINRLSLSALLALFLLAACEKQAPPPPKAPEPSKPAAPAVNEEMKRLAQEGYIERLARDDPELLHLPPEPEAASGKIDAWLAHENIRVVQETSEHWNVLRSLLAQTGSAGNLTTGAHLAALATGNEQRAVAHDQRRNLVCRTQAAQLLEGGQYECVTPACRRRQFMGTEHGSSVQYVLIAPPRPESPRGGRRDEALARALGKVRPS
jgi:hypothetical protein